MATTGVVQVWRALASEAGLPADVLSADELAREARFRRPEDRARFRSAWVLTRLVLGSLESAAPDALAFVRTCRTCGQTGHGKPSLVGSSWEFSLSHAGDQVLLALSSAGAVGVDVEAESAQLTSIASMVRGPGELAATAPELLRVWVRKEAVLKATGDGLAVPMSSFAVSEPSSPARLLSFPADASLRLALADLEVAPGYAAAVAALGVASLRFGPFIPRSLS